MELNQIPQYVQQQLTDFFAHLAYDSLPTYSNSEFIDHESDTDEYAFDTRIKDDNNASKQAH